MSFISGNGPKKFDNEDKIKMFERLGSLGAVLALIIILMIESGKFEAYQNLLDMGLTAMIVVLAVALVGSVFFKTKRK
ncbi:MULTISPECIES: hypothetical protein [unclassified Fibrobacter]|uniref:hypothetical protein n=1 Tax=unclassified Fibrobacter TaxID=2634177 RepID=UPI000911FEB5|nr:MULTISPECIES: hypothetical protein [unclassified Fibrobacter]MCQ2100373.1 hypothetical protein [Fibrobacter sp.]MDO4947152.1 hypothetical protein [Fibrobacter sp.]OWV03825.1 hypothetical protein B7993_12325 [Fibrobacter sp. UWH3]OWV10694.1 hypothetical protein B7992_10985 [Fibrobacter sp. UWH1]SHK88367.1 hypothetical protein SAMN05720764_10546 [Fibrobacter sp. UWH5]